MKKDNVEYLAFYAKKFHGDVILEEDGTICIIARPKLAAHVEDYIDELEKKAKKAKIELTVMTDVLPEYKFSNCRTYNDIIRYRLRIETGCVNVPGYDFIGYVFPVEGNDPNSKLDAVLVPNRNYPNSTEILSELKGIQCVEKCSVCGKKIQRGIYFVFRKQENGKLLICGKNCAKNYFSLTLTQSVIKFVSSFYSPEPFFAFGDCTEDDEEYGSLLTAPMQIQHNYAIAVYAMTPLMYGVAKMQGATANPKYIDSIENILSYLELNNEIPTGDFLLKGRKVYDNYCSLFSDVYDTYEKKDGFYKDMFAWYANECEGNSDFMEKVKSYAAYASAGAFMRKGRLSLNMAAWVTKIYLDTHKELFVSQEETTDTDSLEYPANGTKISGTFKITRIYTPKKDDDDDYYGITSTYYDDDVRQTGAEIKDMASGCLYYISLTNKRPCNYGYSMYHTRKYDHNFTVGEEITLGTARVKNMPPRQEGGKEFHKLTHVKLEWKEDASEKD